MSLNILFLGTPLFAKIVFESLHMDSDFNIVGLITQEDKLFGRKQELIYSATKEYALQNNIAIYQPSNLDYMMDVLSELSIDVIVVVAYGKILPNYIIENYYCINIHASILPYSRGASPMQDMILRRDKYVGVSIIKMDSKLDNGDILSIRYIKNDNYDIESLNKILATKGADSIKNILKKLEFIEPIKQINCDSTYCGKIKRSDGKISFNNASEIFYKLLAYKNWPSVFMDNGLKIIEASIDDLDSNNKNGVILSINNDYIIVGCLIGSLKIYLLQPPGKGKMLATSYIRGKRLSIGDYLC